MKTRFVLCSVVLLALCCFLKAESVVDLTPDTFDKVVDGSKAVLVEFFAPWCGHCKRLAPEYEKVGEAFARSSSVVIAKVDCDAHKSLAQRFEVSGYPTLKFFPAGSKEPEKYSGARTADDIIDFITQKSGARPRTAPSFVVSLTDSNFDEVVNDVSKNVLVQFYGPQCTICKRLAPEYEKLANIFKNEPEVVIAKIDADKYKDIAGRYSVTGALPILHFFSKTNKEQPEEYAQTKDLKSFVQYLNEKAGTQREESGRLTAEAGKIADLDGVAAGFVGSSDKAQLIQRAKEIVKGVPDRLKDSATFYVKIFESIAEKGAEFLEKQKERLSRMIDGGSVKEDKVDEFTRRLNVLRAFS